MPLDELGERVYVSCFWCLSPVHDPRPHRRDGEGMRRAPSIRDAGGTIGQETFG
jgi:hypothetical protein